MHPLLRTLDLTASAGTESSVYDLHPIRAAGSPRSHGIPLLVSLGLTPLVIYGLSISLNSPATERAMRRTLDQARRSVALLLQEPDSTATRAPARATIGPEGPGGAGHREGTNTLDPRLAPHTTVLSKPSDAIDPEQLSVLPTAERVSLSLNPALPLQEGGNGLARGTGRDSALGPGGLIRPPQAADFKLVPLRQVPLYHSLVPGESDRKEPTRVRILIGDNGIPTQAVVVSGPSYLHEEARKAALEWRFEPLGPHGLKAPLTLTLSFQPIVQKPTGVAALEVTPVPTRQVVLSHRLGPGEALSKEPTVVRILIGQDGVPIQAVVFSGPPYLHEKAIRAALEWRFEPLGRLGSMGPVPYTVTFQDIVQAPR